MDYVFTHLFFVASALFPEITDYGPDVFKWVKVFPKYRLTRFSRLGSRSQHRSAQLAIMLMTDDCWNKDDTRIAPFANKNVFCPDHVYEDSHISSSHLKHMIGFRMRNGSRMCTQTRMLEDCPCISILHIDDNLPETHRLFGTIYTLMHAVLKCRDKEGSGTPRHVYLEGKYHQWLDDIGMRYEQLSSGDKADDNLLLPLHRIDIGNNGESIISAVRCMLSHAPIVLVDAHRTHLPRVASH